jgi:ATP synthase protein I
VKIQGRKVGPHAMKKIAPLPDLRDEEPPFKRLTAQEAQRLREQQPQVSPWSVVMGQVGVGLLVALGAWALTGKENVAWSAGYGAMAVVLPTAIFARGLGGGGSASSPTGMVARFFLWEMVKIALTVALLAAAPRVVAGLSWPALLVGVVLTIKVYWVALALASRNVKRRVE